MHALKLGIVSKWTVSDTDSPLVELRKLSNIYGLISLAGIEILFLVSLPFVRRRLYKTFLFSHIIGLALFVGFVSPFTFLLLLELKMDII